jgi:hypothetical protein
MSTSVAQQIFDQMLLLGREMSRVDCGCNAASDCPTCLGCGFLVHEDHSPWMCAFVATSVVENATMALETHQFDVLSELLMLGRDYIARGREIEIANASEAEFADVLRRAVDVLVPTQSAASPTSSRLTPHEIFDLTGEVSPGSVKCTGCGRYTFGIPFDPSLPAPEKWIVGTRYAVCNSDACIAAWDEALDQASLASLARV